MAANIVEGAQCAVGASRNDKRLAQHFAGEEVAHAGHLVDPAHSLPGAGEYLLFLKSKERRLDIPPRRHGRGASQVRLELKVRQIEHSRLLAGREEHKTRECIYTKYYSRQRPTDGVRPIT